MGLESASERASKFFRFHSDPELDWTHKHPAMGLRGKMAQQVVSALGFFPSDG